MTLVPYSTLTRRQRLAYRLAEARAAVWLACRWLGDKLAELARLWLIGVRAIGEWLGLIEPTPPAPRLRPVPTLHPRYSIRPSVISTTGVDLLDHFERIGYPFPTTEGAFSAGGRATRVSVPPRVLDFVGNRAVYLSHFPDQKDAA